MISTDGHSPQGRGGLSSLRAARQTSAVLPASSIGSTGNTFVLRVRFAGCSTGCSLVALRIFLEGLAVGFLLVLLCLLISTNN